MASTEEITPTSDVIDNGGFWQRHVKSIRTRFVLLIALVITAVYSLVALNQIQETSSRLEAELSQQSMLLAKAHAEALADGLWNLNVDVVSRQLSLLVTNQDIISADVMEPNDNVFAAARSGLVFDPGTAAHDERLHIEQPIKTPDDEVIGHLNITVSRDRVNLENARLVRSQLKDFFVVALVVTLVVALTVNRLVQPIMKITQTMTKLAEGNLDTVIPEVGRQDEIGDMARALGIFKANAEAVQRSLEKERELSGLQRQFVSMVSHEFRTPLAVIDGSAQRILRRFDKLEPEQIKVGIDKVRKAVVRLTDLMESVLNSAHLEEGRVDFNPETCLLPSLLRELCISYGEINRDRQIIVNIDQMPESIAGDRRLLHQVFSNLLSNAIKYSPGTQKIWVTGRMQSDSELVVSIRDEGLGIPPDDLKKLFERFFRAGTSIGIAGSGIGLHLVKHFVDLHHGRVDVESTVGVGTEFFVFLPLSMPAEALLADAA